MKGSKLVSVKIMMAAHFKQKICSLTSQKVCFDLKQDGLFNMLIFQLEKVIRCAQMSVDCLRASKLVTLGNTY